MKLEPVSLGPNWWTSLHHTGLLIAPRVVEQFFSEDLAPLPAHTAETLRRSVTVRSETGIGPLLDAVFLNVLGFESAQWNRNPPAEKWSHRLITGEFERPRRVYADCFPIFVEKPDIRLGLGRGRQSVARVVEWLRKANIKLALLATENQWRLIYAGSDFDASCEWNLDLWFEGGKPALQVEALRRLLSPGTVPDRLITAIQDSRRGEAEVSSKLGENARKAVEKLVQASAENLEDLNVLPPDIYLAATRMVMRCVVALFAEGKGMLGRDLPQYHDSYGVQGLREQLERARFANLHETQFAWPRLVSLFRLIYTGSGHPEMLVTRYGGALFEPGDPVSDKPIVRAVAAFEKTYPCPNDREVYEILALLTRTYLNIRQGRTTRPIPTPIDFSSLDTEYIGTLYEGLLDYDLKRATEPVVFVLMGDEPALPISQLETIAPAKLKVVFGKLKKKSQLAVSEDDDEEEDEEDYQDNEEADSNEQEHETTTDIETEENVDEADASIARAHAWAIEAVKAARLVVRPRSQRAEALRKYEEDVAAAAKKLFSRVVRPGDWYLVRFGNTRKGSGTFYTRKELAGPTVRRTLQPLVYEGGTPRKPEDILALKVCDPACGSGSFLISGVRFLTEALFQSLYQHGRIQDAGNHTKLYDLGVRKEDLPATDNFDDQLRARLRRHVVERCLYGVDLNPLALELARMSLWIETLDPRLPFGFLDHKLKVGNALVGCWFDRFEDYPAMAWAREGGDKDYEPINSRPNWTKAIASRRNDYVKPSLVNMIGSGEKQQLLWEGETPADIAKRARERLLEIHRIGVHDPDEQRRKYHELRADTAFQRLLSAFDLWCALWFWPADRLDGAPLAKGFISPTPESLQIATEVSVDRHFFHWELEFPDVFNAPGAGFDAIVGNPPWEIQKPNSKEFFSNIDPLYRGYGKQEALSRQKEYFKRDARHEQAWISERARIKALANWVKYVSVPFGDEIRIDKKLDFSLAGSFAKSFDLHRRWQLMRKGRSGYADAQHPFLHQGSADLNTYKMFLEQAYRVLRPAGRLGMIAPSGIYSDQGSTALRTLFLEKSQWEWLFSFDNRYGIFDIHRSFKFNPLVVQKGGQTEAIQTAFMRHNPKEWDEAENHVLAYPGERVKQFSPASKALLEIRSEQDLRTVEKLYAAGTLLGDSSPGAWRIQYLREFDMAGDSDQFPPRPDWEARGFAPDEYGHWIKGAWRPHDGCSSILKRCGDLVLSQDGTRGLMIGEIEDIALPLYEGRMIGQFDFSEKAWISGKGRGAIWHSVAWSNKVIRPQFLMGLQDYLKQSGDLRQIRVSHMRVGSATNERSAIATLLIGFPTGDTAANFVTPDAQSSLLLVAVLNSFVYDFIMRKRLVGLHMDFHVYAQNPLPMRLGDAQPFVSEMVLGLSAADRRFALLWLQFPDNSRSWYRRWALTDTERLRRRVILDAVIASIANLTVEEFGQVLADCDHPEWLLKKKPFRRGLDPKGFWRVDEERPPHLRHTVLSLVAFHELQRIGLDAFLALNDGEGWMLPDTLRLADYGLGHDDRAKEHQPLASFLGPRFYDWQLSQSVEESWEECKMHAELLNEIVPPSPPPEQQPPEQPQALLAFIGERSLLTNS